MADAHLLWCSIRKKTNITVWKGLRLLSLSELSARLLIDSRARPEIHLVNEGPYVEHAAAVGL